MNDNEVRERVVVIGKLEAVEMDGDGNIHLVLSKNSDTGRRRCIEESKKMLGNQVFINIYAYLPKDEGMRYNDSENNIEVFSM